jgi:hypothetical protein
MDSIARRELSVADTADVVTVEIGPPRQVGVTRWGHPDWECLYQIRSPKGVIERRAGGIDSMQALIVALTGIRVDLKGLGLPLTWLGLPETGIPRMIIVAWPPGFSEELEQMVDRELAVQARKDQEAEGRGRG